MDLNAQKFMSKAHKAREAQNWPVCEKNAKKVQKAYPRNVEALMLYGLALFHQGKLQAAYKTFSSVNALQPENMQALQDRALIAVQLNKSDWVDSVFKEAFALDAVQNDPLIHHFYGVYLQNNGQGSEALTYYKKVLDIDANAMIAKETMLNMAALLYQFKDYESACGLWSEYLRREPKDAKIMAYLSDGLGFLGQHDEATAMAVQGLAHNPDSPRSQAAFIHALRRVSIEDYNDDICKALY